jgi:hypothetical protein
MNHLLRLLISFCTLIPITISTVFAQHWSGIVQAEFTVFPKRANWPNQKSNDVSLLVMPEYYKQWENSSSSLIFVPFVRIDTQDSERSHFDIRELAYVKMSENWELQVGVGKVFWGVTEFVHLVDIINQTDGVESLEGTEKLGQPMINLSIFRPWGVIDFFVLPYFRERTFPGHQGRLRFPIVIDQNNAIYESSRKQYHTDFAARYSRSIGKWDLGISHFIGTGRDPTLLLKQVDGSGSILVPYYHLINQTSIDFQFVGGNWLYKLEALYRSGQDEDFVASVAGMEYTLPSKKDINLFAEWAFDSRKEKSTSLYQNDIILGSRLNLNDPQGSVFTIGAIHDLNNSSNALKVEGSRRFGSNWRASIESWVFFNVSENDIIYGLRDDDLFRIKMSYYF